MTDLDKTLDELLDSIYQGDKSRSEIKQEILQWAEAERKKHQQEIAKAKLEVHLEYKRKLAKL